MKSELFKTAWKLVKELNLTMSEALKSAWASFKAGAKADIHLSWNGIKSIIFRKDGCTSGTIERLLELTEIPTFNNNPAMYDYGCGKYNGD